MIKILGILVLLLPLKIFAQGNLQNFNTGNSPLPNNTIRSIALDNNGIKWFATDFGLASFNDTSWTVYQSGSFCFSSNSFRAIAIGPGNKLWAGTFNDGIYVFKDSCIAHYNSLNSPLPDDHIRSLAFDSSGNAWIGTSGGLAILADSGWAVFNSSNSPLGSNNISALHYTSMQTMLVGTINGGLTVIDTGDSWTTYNTSNSGIPDNTILALSEDSGGNYLLGTAAAGLSVFVSATSSWLIFNPITSLMQSYTVNDLLPGSGGRIIMATADTGLTLRENNNSFSHLQAGNSTLPDNRLTKIIYESPSTYWIGTIDDGVVKLDTSFATGISQYLSPQSIKSYPNPASTEICFELPEESLPDIYFYNVLGEKLGSWKATALSRSHCVPISLTPGVYFVLLKDKNAVPYLSRFIVN